MCEVPVGANSQTQVAAECIGVAVVTRWALARVEVVCVGELAELSLIEVDEPGPSCRHCLCVQVK